jgi:hypothetical protein
MNLQELTFDELMDQYDEHQDYSLEVTAFEDELRRRVIAGESIRLAANDLVKSWTDRASGEKDSAKAAALALCAVELKSILGRSGQFPAARELVKEGV